MAIYAISDLHLAISIDKPMDIFGHFWEGYMDKLQENWWKKVKEDDLVIISGDVSWATYIEDAKADFKFIEELPGKKIISKGNHDYWWTSLSKLNKFLYENNFSTIKFLHNNSYTYNEYIICGTRGWKCPGDEGFNSEDFKIYKREVQRLELSLKSAANITDKKVLASLHYPPFNSKGEASEFCEVLEKYDVHTCIYGHLHGIGFKNAFEGDFNDINYKLVSSDYLKFEPCRLA